jgi:prepilin-type N-terminal cleavage/methylation domain-containing protein
MNQRGFTLIEMIVVVAIMLVVASIAVPQLRAYSEDASLLGAGRQFRGAFRLARSVATRSNVETAIRFEELPDGMYFSVYADTNYNGVLAAEIRNGVDKRLSGPQRLDAGAPGVRVGINPDVPEIPPARGILDPSDPIRFGPSNMLSFSPMGTATPGTFYLAGQHAQAAVRVTPGSARVRLMICRARLWAERP